MKTFIKQIENLDWTKIDPYILIYQSELFAREFADTARSCILEYGHISEFREFIGGELGTNNLVHGGYYYYGDHYEFLEYWRRVSMEYKNGLRVAREMEQEFVGNMSKAPRLDDSIRRYLKFMSSLSLDQKLSTLISREEILQGIFANILQSHNWKELSLGFFEYYLERHIELDSEEGGHEDLTKSLLDLRQYKDLLTVFWWHRWEVYRTLYDYS